MEQKLYDIEMIFIQDAGDNRYRLECVGRHQNSVVLNFEQVEGIELAAGEGVEVKHSYIQMTDNQSKMWNLKFKYPTAISVRFMGKILIDVIK
jgi:hypothetical protein